jgi:mannose-6-phosphate isomerase-like protein (cupin superfamily)
VTAASTTCATVDTGWRPGDASPQRFSAHGGELAVELISSTAEAGLALTETREEEMGAALEGRFVLTCGEETHELAAGQGILIPAGEPRQWRLMSETGVLYRVWRR